MSNIEWVTLQRFYFLQFWHEVGQRPTKRFATPRRALPQLPHFPRLVPPTPVFHNAYSRGFVQAKLLKRENGSTCAHHAERECQTYSTGLRELPVSNRQVDAQAVHLTDLPPAGAGKHDVQGNNRSVSSAVELTIPVSMNLTQSPSLNIALPLR